MAKLQIQNFGGEVPRQSDTMLKENDASFAQNVRLYSGELRTWNGPSTEFTPANSNVIGIYKFVQPTTLNYKWLTWTHDVDVATGSLADTSDFRLYYTGDTVPKKTNYSMASGGSAPYPSSWYNMGVPAPAAAATVAATAGGSALNSESRYYVYTYVSTFGSITEESAPSPVSAVVNITAGQKVTINAFTAAPTSGYNITHKRIYRTQPGETSSGAFVFVAEITEATTSYVDDLLATQVGAPLSTVGWDAPPATLTGIVNMANGMMAGFVGNSVYFCEPYYHHAWPSAYVQSVPEQIVGLGAYGNTLIVMTQGSPYAMVGVHPTQVSVERITIPEPCITKRSIAFDQYGVVYASPNGVVGIGPNSRGVMTNELFRRTEWQDYQPATMIAKIYDGKYLATFQSSTQGSRTMIISRDDVPALSFIDFRAAAFYVDLSVGALFYLDYATNLIKQLDADTVNPLFYQWQSKRFVLPKAMTWSMLKVDLDETQLAANSNYAAQLAAVVAANQAITGSTFGEINGSAVDTYAINASLLVDAPPPASSTSCSLVIYGELNHVMCALTIDRYSPYRIPAFKSREIAIKLTGNVSIRSVSIATSGPELRDENWPELFAEARGDITK